MYGVMLISDFMPFLLPATMPIKVPLCLNKPVYAPIFLPEPARALLPASGKIAELRRIEALPEYQLTIVTAGAKRQ